MSTKIKPHSAGEVGPQSLANSLLDTPEVMQTNEQLSAVIHLTIPRSEIGNVMGAAIAEISAVLAAQGLVADGPCFSYHLKLPAENFDFEVGFPVSRPITTSGRVKMSKLPAVTLVRTRYRGGYEGLGDAWGAFCAWIEAQGLHAQDCLWECYTTGPESSPDPAMWCTELNRPLAEPR